jgi:hypothetical protein
MAPSCAALFVPTNVSIGNAYLCRACEALRRCMLGQATVSARPLLEFMIWRLLQRMPRDAAASVHYKMTPFPKALFEPLAALLGSEVGPIQQTAGQRGGRKTARRFIVHDQARIKRVFGGQILRQPGGFGSMRLREDGVIIFYVEGSERPDGNGYDGVAGALARTLALPPTLTLTRTLSLCSPSLSPPSTPTPTYS